MCMFPVPSITFFSDSCCVPDTLDNSIPPHILEQMFGEEIDYTFVNNQPLVYVPHYITNRD